MRAGPRDKKITIERYTAGAEDAMGGRSKVWGKHLDAWASVNYGTGAERRERGAEGSAISATFRILSSVKAREITTKDRLRISGETANWDITSVAPVGLNEGHDITAKRNNDGKS